MGNRLVRPRTHGPVERLTRCSAPWSSHTRCSSGTATPFDLPEGAVHLAQSKTCENQAFRYGHNAYGLQCHLELDERLINRWLSLPEYLEDLEENGRRGDATTIQQQTHELIGQSADLSSEIFGQFLRPLGQQACVAIKVGANSFAI